MFKTKKSDALAIWALGEMGFEMNLKTKPK